jgi:hypothetical protein
MVWLLATSNMYSTVHLVRVHVQAAGLDLQKEYLFGGNLKIKQLMFALISV